MAVLPTPGSPISTGLFFVRRDRISMVCSISSARPITGSSLPSRASWVRSRLCSSSVLVALALGGLTGAVDAPNDRSAQFRVTEPEPLEDLAGPGVLIAREGQQDVLGPDVGGPHLACLLVAREDRSLGVGRQGRGDVGGLASFGLLLDLCGDGLRIGAHLFQHVHNHLVVERRSQQVVGVEVEAAPLDGCRRRPLEELARRVAEERGHVDLLDGRPSGRSRRSGGSGRFGEA